MEKSLVKRPRTSGKKIKKKPGIVSRKKSQLKKTDDKQKQQLEKEAYQNPDFTTRKEIVKLHLNKNGIILNVNKAAAGIYGLKPQKMAGLPLSMFIHPQDLADTMELLFPESHHDREKIVFHKNRHISNDGKVFYMSWISTLHFDKLGSLLFVDTVATGIMELVPPKSRIIE